MLLSSRAAGCLLITTILLMTVPSMGSRRNGRMRASVQQVYDNRPFSAVYNEKHPDAPSKTQDGYFLGPYQPEEAHHTPDYMREPPYNGNQYPDARQAPTDNRHDYDHSEQPRYQPDQERYSAYGREERESRDDYESEGTREAYRPQHRPEPEPYQQYQEEHKGPDSRESYRGDSEMRSEHSYPSKRGYGYDDDEHQDRQGQYKEQDREEQYNEPRSYEQYKEREYKNIVPICLQRTSSTVSAGSPAIVEDTFRCCGPADDADICENNSTSPYPEPTPYDEDMENQHDFMSNLISRNAATCKKTVLTETCPAFVATICSVVQFNCTLTKAAAKCGCPVRGEGYLAFSIKAYATKLDPVAACLSAGNPPVVTAVQAQADWLQGALTALQSQDGVESVTGAVEYVYAVQAAQNNPAAADDSKFVREGQMIIRMLHDK